MHVLRNLDSGHDARGDRSIVAASGVAGWGEGKEGGVGGMPEGCRVRSGHSPTLPLRSAPSLDLISRLLPLCTSLLPLSTLPHTSPTPTR